MSYATFTFPAVKGIQAKREYYISMVPLGIIPKLFQFQDEDLPPEVRAQRILNKSRVPEIRDYILKNPDSYVFSSLTVSVDGEIFFTPSCAQDPLIGHISISMNAQFLINDGQHRRAAIAEAIKQNPLLKDEHISVVFYHDEGLKRSQQMFSDLNRYAIRPTKSINILFDSREDAPIIAKHVIDNVPVFCGLTEKEHTSISNRSKALFTLSAICTATEQLLKNSDLDLESQISLSIQFWSAVSDHIPLWKAVKCGELKSSEVRKNYICSLSLTLVAIGSGGNALLKYHKNNWSEKLSILETIDWHKENPIWNDLVFINGRVAANRATQKAMSAYIQELFLGNAGVRDV